MSAKAKNAGLYKNDSNRKPKLFMSPLITNKKIVPRVDGNVNDTDPMIDEMITILEGQQNIEKVSYLNDYMSRSNEIMNVQPVKYEDIHQKQFEMGLEPPRPQPVNLRGSYEQSPYSKIIDMKSSFEQ